jgi:hypothetical protein
MKEVKRIDQLGDEWERRRRQIDTARRHPLGFLWVGYLELRLEEAIQRYKEEEEYLRQKCYQMTRGPFSGIHG